MIYKKQGLKLQCLAFADGTVLLVEDKGETYQMINYTNLQKIKGKRISYEENGICGTKT